MSHSITYIGAKWCSICKTIKPQLEEICKKFQIPIEIKDLDEDCTEQEIAEIKKVPTVQIRTNAEIVQVYNVKQVESVETWLKANATLVEDNDF
jgi:thiol-disulfide isomerase/thioredoxin